MTDFAWTARRVTEALNLPQASWDHAYTGVSTDTRTLREGELFVALKGERFDAHDFLGDARLAGVGGVVVRRSTARWPGFDWFEVEDTLAALGALARHRRQAFAGTVIAVTGTNGKTSTKEMIAAALGAGKRVHKSERNLNNLVGVPLTVLSIPEEVEAAVVECGASLPGELARLRDVVRPDVAVVTNVGPGHLEGFGAVERVLEEKVSLLAGAAVAVVGTEPRALAEAARAVAKRVIVAGEDAGADWCADQVTMLPDGRPRFRVRGVEAELPLHGRHMVGNALLALAAADAAGVPVEAAAPALSRARVPGGRSEMLELGGVTVINDCYNSNPASLMAALQLLDAVRGGRPAVVVVGTMRELGAASEQLHEEAARAVIAARPDLVAAVGDFAPVFRRLEKRLGKGKLIVGEDAPAVAEPLKERLKPGDVLLLKASRGVALERLFPLLWPDHPTTSPHP